MNDGTRDLKQVARLQALASSVRRRDLEMVYGAKLGHIGGDFSAIDILVTLYFGVLRIDPSRPDDPERDGTGRVADGADGNEDARSNLRSGHGPHEAFGDADAAAFEVGAAGGRPPAAHERFACQIHNGIRVLERRDKVIRRRVGMDQFNVGT